MDSIFVGELELMYRMWILYSLVCWSECVECRLYIRWCVGVNILNV